MDECVQIWIGWDTLTTDVLRAEQLSLNAICSLLF